MQDDWRYVPVEQEEVFTAIRPGEYLMEVQTQTNTGGVWTTIYTLNMDVLPAWHQAWWFRYWSYWRWRWFSLRCTHFGSASCAKEYELRKQVSDDLHDDLESSRILP